MAQREHNPWTDEEIDILRKYYPYEGSKVSDRVNHSPASCRTRAGLLGLHYYKTKPEGRRWSDDEDEILRTTYPTKGTAVITDLPGKTRNQIIARAIRLGLHVVA